MATIKEIAQLAGVSRGTVDRILNNRGMVSPEKRQKVMEIAKALNYMPNLAGKTLALKKKQLKFGYILFGSTAGNPFFAEVVRGIESRAAELTEYGVSVEIRYAHINKPEAQLNLIDELLEKNIAGLAITPINHPLVTERLQKLSDEGFPIVTVNSDIPSCGRICYVGSDYAKSGETAAGLMNLICAGKANIGVVSGSEMILCHSERLAGFTRRIEEQYSGLRLIKVEYNNDDDIQSYIVTKRLLEEHPEIDALYLVAAGVVGACRALCEDGRKDKIKVIGFDVTSSSRPLLEKGDITALITQEPFVQGAKPLDILMDYAGMDIEPVSEIHHTELGIVIKENL